MKIIEILRCSSLALKSKTEKSIFFDFSRRFLRVVRSDND